jgi:hypothetical protein
MLPELKSQENELMAQLALVRSAIIKERLQIAFSTYGVQIGSVVKDQRGKEYEVVEIRTFSDCSKPWLTTKPRKTDGTFGTARRNLCGDWVVVSS